MITAPITSPGFGLNQFRADKTNGTGPLTDFTLFDGSNVARRTNMAIVATLRGLSRDVGFAPNRLGYPGDNNIICHLTGVAKGVITLWYKLDNQTRWQYYMRFAFDVPGAALEFKTIGGLHEKIINVGADRSLQIAACSMYADGTFTTDIAGVTGEANNDIWNGRVMTTVVNY